MKQHVPYVRRLFAPIGIEIISSNLQPTHDFGRFPMPFVIYVDLCPFFFFGEVEWVRNITAGAHAR